MILKTTAAAIALALTAMNAQAAPAILNTGTIQMGVADNGGLGSLGVGLTGPTGDALTPGCLCEGWGASASGSAGYVYGLGGSGIISANLTTTTASGASLSAQSVVKMSNGLTVTQTYSYAGSGTLFQTNVTLTNSTASILSDVRYARTLDWDVTPGYFTNNYTTIYGGTPTGPGGKVLHTSSNPFAVPNPLFFRTDDSNTNIVNSIGDKGSYFVFGFGDLLAGDSVSFDTFIGANNSVSGLLSALSAEGVEAYSYTTGNNPGTDGYAHSPAYGYGFKGLDLQPAIPSQIPEPSTLALLGLGATALLTRRRQLR